MNTKTIAYNKRMLVVAFCMLCLVGQIWSGEEIDPSIQVKSLSLINTLIQNGEYNEKVEAISKLSAIPKSEWEVMLKGLLDFRTQRNGWFGEHRTFILKKERILDDYLVGYWYIERFANGLVVWSVVWYKGDAGWKVLGIGCNDTVKDVLN